MGTNEVLLDVMLNIAERLEGDVHELMSCSKVISDMANLVAIKANAIEKGVDPATINKTIEALK